MFIAMFLLCVIDALCNHMDLRVGVGNAMLLFATRVHRGHA